MKNTEWNLGFQALLCGLFFLGAPGVEAQPVACLQKGKMDLTRPEFPSVTCWETLATDNQPESKLQEACETRFGPWGIESAVVPMCPPKPLGSCFDVKDGQANGASAAGVEFPDPFNGLALTHTHHYTPQLPHEWKKTAKICKKSGGKWVGPGSESSLLPF